MQNFNTNQTRQFYIAGAIDSNLDTNLDIYLGSTATGEMYFQYVNADGLLTRSDTFDPCKIISLKDTPATAMARPLMMHTVAIDTTAVTLSDLVGKTLSCIITISGAFDYDMDNSITFTASVTGNATNTASAAAFHKDLAIAIAKALPRPDKKYPFIKVFSSGSEVLPTTAASDVTGAAAGVVLVEGVQKYVRGKLSGEPSPFSVAFRLADGNLGDIVWGTDTVAKSNVTNNTTMPANYVVADLEYFALGERGDVYRGSRWPNDYDTTYVVNPFGNTAYDILTIEYYWAGDAENVQKSPRMIQVAAEHAASDNITTTLYSAILAAKNGD